MHKGLFSIPASRATSITPTDGVEFTPAFRSLFVGGTGNVTVIPENQSDAVTFWGVQDGTILPISVKAVLASGTTATQILGLR